MKRDVPGPGVDGSDVVPIVVATTDGSEEIIESVAIASPDRARGWLVSIPRDFRPPEPDWYYIYITSQETRFWDGDRLLLDAGSAAVTIFPPGIEHVARLDEPAFVFGVSTPDPGEVDPSAWPRTASVARMEGVLKTLAGRPLRLVAGKKLKDEEDWEDRDWSLDEQGGVPTRQVWANHRDLFELSAMDAGMKKQAKLRRRTFEAYASFSDIQLFWKDTKENFQTVKGPAIVVVSPPFCRAASASGMTFVLGVSGDGSGIGDDTAPCVISSPALGGPSDLEVP